MTTMLYCMSQKWYCEYRCADAFKVWIYHDGRVNIRIDKYSTGLESDTHISMVYKDKEAAREDIFTLLEQATGKPQ